MPAFPFKLSLRFALASLAVCFLAVGARAHDPGLSAADIRLSAAGVAADLSFAPSDLQPSCIIDIDDDQNISAAEFAIAKPTLERLALGALEIKLDGKTLTLDSASADFDTTSNAVVLRLRFAPAAGTRLELRSTILESLARGQKQLVTLRNENDRITAERVLAGGNDTFAFEAFPLGTSSSWLPEFLVLGLEHILTGYDHLAFLLALLLAGGTLWETTKVISSFTVAHSISLVLATFDLVRVPSGVVEPLIAASIIYIAVENLYQRNLKTRWLLTFAFGLVHGMGFASVLRELGLGRIASEAVVPLLSFNLGVELGQIAIATLILPVIWRLRRRRTFVISYAPACSASLALLGCYWLIERTLIR